MTEWMITGMMSHQVGPHSAGSCSSVPAYALLHATTLSIDLLLYPYLSCVDELEVRNNLDRSGLARCQCDLRLQVR